jgi:thymidylate kinase
MTVRKLVRIIKANHPRHQRTTEDGKPLNRQQLIPSIAATHGQTFSSSQLDALYTIEKIAIQSRVSIIEGISGSGKDMLQTYLKQKLTSFNVYDYSEGEVLQSWNQLRIKGIPQLRLHFMKLFVKYMKDTLRREGNNIFILNRFHLSAYAMTVAQRPKLERQYDEIIKILRTMPVHVFILQLDETEIEKRSLHPERSGAWQKFQQEIVEEEGFHDRLERYLWQQRLMLQAAARQKLPYSIINCFPDVQQEWVSTEKVKDFFNPKFLRNTTATKISGKKRRPFTRIV